MAGNGSVYQRKDGRWVGKYYVNDPITGKSKPKFVYSSLEGRKGQQEVKRKLNALIEQVDAGDLSDVYKTTVAGWLMKFMEVYCSDLAVTTREGYQRYIDKHIVPVIGDIKLCDLKPLHIQTFYNSERKAGYSEKTLLQEHRILHRAFKKAKGDGMIKMNPCEGVDAPSPEDYEPDIYTEEEYMLLLDKLQGHKMEVVILIAGMCGLRRGELMGLTWDDIDLDNGIISVERNVVPTKKGNLTKVPKNRTSKREFTIPSVIIPRLKLLRGIGRLYLRPDGKAYHPSSIDKAFKNFLKSNNLRHIRLHDLRHFNATMMLKHGVSEREAQERLGHSNANMTKKYQHILKEMDQNSADKLNEIFNSKTK